MCATFRRSTLIFPSARGGGSESQMRSFITSRCHVTSGSCLGGRAGQRERREMRADNRSAVGIHFPFFGDSFEGEV